MTESKKNNKKSFGCTAYKIVTIVLLLAILGMFFNFITQIKNLQSTFETTAPNLENSIAQKIDIGTKDVLNHIAISEKVSAPNSDVVLHKAKLLEYLRVVSEAKIALANGNLSEEKLAVFDTIENEKIIKESDQLKMFAINPPTMPSDKDIAVALLDNIKLTTKVSIVGNSDLQKQVDTNATPLEKLKSKSMNYLSKLVKVEPTSTNHIDKDNTQTQSTKYQPQDLAYFLLQKGEYKILLEILSKHALTDKADSILEIVKLKSQIKEHLMQIEQLLLE